MPVFLHANFMHILLNSFSTFIIGSSLEKNLGAMKIASIYFLSGFGGILFSCVFNPTSNSVGASTAIFGMIGYYVAFLFVNWTKLGAEDPMRRMSLAIFTALILLFNFQMGITNPTVDNMGHLGGLITGIFVGLALSKEYYKQGYFCLGVYLISFLMIFYLLIVV